MMTFTSQILMLLLLLLSSIIFNKGVSTCNEKDQRTLLIFKKGIIDHFGRLSTWSSEEDCCAWKGVQCDNNTGRVTKLDLSPPYEEKTYNSLEGEINFVFLELEFLNYVDLRENEFDMIRIQPIHYNVTYASKLRYLDLSWNAYDIHIDNIHRVSELSSLKYLNLNGVDLHKETDWLQVFSMFPSLLELYLKDCNLNYISPSLKYITSLETLDLSLNNFNFELPKGLFNLTKDISYLDFSSSKIHGELPLSLSNLVNLTYLDLSYNQLKGSIPSWIGQLGSIPRDWDNMKYLIDINLWSNRLAGEALIHLSNLKRLRVINLGKNQFSGMIPINLPQKLQVIILRDNQFEGNIPAQVFNLSSLFHLDLAHNNLSGSIPQSVYNMTPMIIVGTQLQSFDASSYNGNRELCGAPLKKCIVEEDLTRTNPSMKNEDDDSLRESLYLGLGVGFAAGFW
ncbi:LRR receptor-like kinase resistance protein, partial [Trifolium pratense]